MTPAPSKASSHPPRPRPTVLVVALALAFFALALTGESNAWFGQTAYLASAVLLGFAGRRTFDELGPPSRWAALSCLGGLMATEVFAATELAVVDSADWQGVGALIVPAWLFAAVGWVTHMRAVRSLRWVVTLVQVSFTSLSAALFAVLAIRSDRVLGFVGYGAAAILGVAAAALAFLGIALRVQIELRARATGA